MSNVICELFSFFVITLQKLGEKELYDTLLIITRENESAR